MAVRHFWCRLMAYMNNSPVTLAPQNHVSDQQSGVTDDQTNGVVVGAAGAGEPNINNNDDEDVVMNAQGG